MMRLHPEDLGLLTEVIWYYVPEGRPWIPYANPFGSRDWEFADGRGEALLGEVAGTRSYYSGVPPVDLDGQNFCGSRAQWERGASLLDKPLPLNPTTQQQCCCGSGGAALVAGSVEGMTLELETPPLVTTCALKNPSPQRWQVTIAGVTNGFCADCAALNGTFILEYVSGCTWISAPVPFCGGSPGWRLDIGIGGAQVWLRLFGGGTGPTEKVRFRSTVAGWLNFGPNPMVFFQSGGQCVTWPFIVTVSPAF